MQLLLPVLLFAAPAAAGSTLEREIIAELNRARTDPRGYADRLAVYRRYFNGKVVRYPGNPDGLRTAEGVAAVDEAIRVLRRQPPVRTVRSATLLTRAARDHVEEQGPRGVTGHPSANGDRVRQRLVRRGGGDYVAEVITYGPPSAVEVVRQLIVDDNVPDRGHRRSVYAAQWAYAGAACGPHKRYKVMCVVTFARTPTGHP
ncbi:CAP domain-containing protein [Sphingomonas sp.]|uniref:CAP domain-containing protein n=1 Tax=Sphingomonas sp. TaxID=28214 RepID=UPI0031D2E8F0